MSISESSQNQQEASGNSSTEPPVKRRHIEAPSKVNPFRSHRVHLPHPSIRKLHPRPPFGPRIMINSPSTSSTTSYFPMTTTDMRGWAFPVSSPPPLFTNAGEEGFIAEAQWLSTKMEAVLAEREEEKRLRAEAELRCSKLQADLEEQSNALRMNIEGLHKERAEMKDTIGGLDRKLECMDDKVVLAEEAHISVERALAGYKAIGPPLTEEVRRQVQQEYQRSTDLNDEIIHQFIEGYQEARDKDKKRVLAAKLDPSIIDSSDDEAEA